jgi:hypothetical protein
MEKDHFEQDDTVRGGAAPTALEETQTLPSHPSAHALG